MRTNPIRQRTRHPNLTHRPNPQHRTLTLLTQPPITPIQRQPRNRNPTQTSQFHPTLRGNLRTRTQHTTPHPSRLTTTLQPTRNPHTTPITHPHSRRNRRQITLQRTQVRRITNTRRTGNPHHRHDGCRRAHSKRNTRLHKHKTETANPKTANPKTHKTIMDTSSPHNHAQPITDTRQPKQLQQPRPAPTHQPTPRDPPATHERPHQPPPPTQPTAQNPTKTPPTHRHASRSATQSHPQPNPKHPRVYPPHMKLILCAILAGAITAVVTAIWLTDQIRLIIPV